MQCSKHLSSGQLFARYAADNQLPLRDNIFDVNTQITLPFMTQVTTNTAYVLRLSTYDAATPNVVAFTISFLDISKSPVV